MSEQLKNERSGICGICNAGCWIIATFDEEGNIVSVRADEGSPMGIICKIGEHSPEIIYSENRIKTPLKRKGQKGTFDFEPISWDEAYTIIVANLNRIKKESGPEATAIYTGVGTFELSLCDIFQPKDVAISSASSVLFPFGSPNTMGVGALCYVSYGMISPHVTCGKMLFEMFNDISNTDLVVVWGTNPATDLPPIEMNHIMEAKNRGAEVVVIDPRRTMTVKLADAEWIPIRPGTDCALVLGMCHVFIEEELYDDDFVTHWTVGFEDFSRYVQHFRPEVVEDITGVPKETIVTFTRKLASANGATQHMYTGMEYSPSGVQGIRATLVLWALAGQLDVPGGRCFQMAGNSFPINRSGLLSNPGDKHNRIGADRFPVYIHYRDEAHAIGLPESVLEGDPYKIRSLIIQGGSIITSWPNPSLWKKTLSSLDFLVCIDRQYTADAAYADIVLPATTHYEIQSYMTYGSLFRIREKLIDPVGEARSDYDIMTELATRLGHGHLYPQGADAMLAYVLEGSGFTLEDVRNAGGTVSIDTHIMQYKKWEKGLLRKDGQKGFDTPSGKFEIASTILDEYGYDALPVYTEPTESPLSRPDLLKKFPLVFNSGARVRTSFHTQHRGVKGLTKDHPEPIVTLNSKDAKARNISQGDMVTIETVRGKITMRARVTDDIAPGAIDANHACGTPVGPKAWQETNVNELTDLNQYDPISGFPVYKCLLCDVQKTASNEQHKDLDKEQLPVISSCEISADELSFAHYEKPEKIIYLDNNATTVLSEPVKNSMKESLEVYGNPSSIHELGKMSRSTIDKARRTVAQIIGTTAKRVIFTGSGSEANNLAIKGVAFASDAAKNHIITSEIEHPAVLKTCEWLEKNGFSVTYLPVDSYGLVEPESLAKAITSKTALVSIMFANNETGTIQPIQELVHIAHEMDVLFHTDAVQAFGKIPVSVKELGIDLLSLSAHKVHGPKGVGALFMRKGIAIEELISGGGQEHKLRAGTENISGIVGFAKACESVDVYIKKAAETRSLRDLLEKGIAHLVPGYKLNGHRESRLPNTLNVTLPGFRGESIVMAMNKRGIYFSSGSACKSGSPLPSHALLAMGMSEEEAHCALRFSLGMDTTKEDIDLVLTLLEETINESKNIVQFVPCR